MEQKTGERRKIRKSVKLKLKAVGGQRRRQALTAIIRWNTRRWQTAGKYRLIFRQQSLVIAEPSGGRQARIAMSYEGCPRNFYLQFTLNSFFEYQGRLC